MRGSKRNPWLFGLGGLLAVLVVYGGHARADVATDRAGSVIVFPKVIADGVRDTLIQIANTKNTGVAAHCIYVNAAGLCGGITGRGSQFCNVDTDCPIDVNTDQPQPCVHQCDECDFDIFLTPQQPTVWRKSTGRAGFDGFDGFPPGSPDKCVTQPFVGELKCIEVAGDGSPKAGNSLKGEATIVGQGPGNISQYNAIAIMANSASALDFNGGFALNFTAGWQCEGGGDATDGQSCTPPGSPPHVPPLTTCTGTCTKAVGEYNPCPADLVMNHYPQGAFDDFTFAQSFTEVTLVPCTELIEPFQQPVRVSANFEAIDDMEVSLGSAHVDGDCQLNMQLSDPRIAGGTLFTFLGTTGLKTRIRPPSGKLCYTGDRTCHFCQLNDTDSRCDGQPPGFDIRDCVCTTDDDDPVTGCPNALPDLGCRPWPGLLGVAEEYQVRPSSPPGTAAKTLFMEGIRDPGADLITIGNPQ